jgi:hypothetical protein
MGGRNGLASSEDRDRWLPIWLSELAGLFAGRMRENGIGCAAVRIEINLGTATERTDSCAELTPAEARAIARALLDLAAAAKREGPAGGADRGGSWTVRSGRRPRRGRDPARGD